jgi:hypothetical protein
VIWAGVGASEIPLTSDTASVGDFIYTSSTPGEVTFSATRTTGAIGKVIEVDGSGNPIFVEWWGVPDGASGTSVTDHGDLTGLADNDHPQYRLTTDGGQDVVNVVAAAGSTETLDLADGNVHDVTLTADCTLTLAGATAGVECSMAVLLRQGSGAPWDVTWPGSVEWVGGSAPTLETAEDAWNWVSLTTLDGGTTWFGNGGAASDIVAALDDLTDVTITTPAEGDMLRFDGSAWVNTDGRYEPVTDGVDTFVWDGAEIVMAWTET